MCNCNQFTSYNYFCTSTKTDNNKWYDLKREIDRFLKDHPNIKVLNVETEKDGDHSFLTLHYLTIEEDE